MMTKIFSIKTKFFIIILIPALILLFVIYLDYMHLSSLGSSAAWRVWPQIDAGKLQAAAPLFIGQHDFASFGTPPRTGGSTVRNVMSTLWKAKEDEWHFEVQANAFLYRMVRRLVFIQVVLAQGKISVEAIARALAGQADELERSELPSGLAPACGLTLVEVTYPPEISFGHFE